MAESDIAKKALKVVVGQICQNIGWHAVQSSPMDILVDVLQRYIFEIAKSVHQYSTQYNRTEPNLDDLGLTFKDFGIVLQEIEEYINNVESVPPAYKIASFPVKHSSNLQIPKPDSRELLVRPEHIPSYLPLMHPDEEDLLFSQQSAIDSVKKNSLEGANGDSSPLSSPKHGLKRHEWPSENSKNKSRFYSEEEGRPMREVTSVFMTPAGFVSPIHEGKVPDASLPCLVDSPPPSPEGPSNLFISSSSKKDLKPKESKKEKSSKSKKDKKVSEKDLKKLKSSKKEKENKENAVSKHEKSLTSSGSKKDHSSSHKSSKAEKSMKSDESVRQKSKSEKMKLKAHKDDLRKVKDTFKLSSKLKAKFKHSGGSGSSSHIKSSKLSSKKLKASKLSKIKHLKQLEKSKVVELPPRPVTPPPAPAPPPKEIVFEHKVPLMEPKEVSEEMLDDFMEEDELDFREESPERLVIDDSLETQARQERESRLEVIDECIDAVIRRGEEESAEDNRAMDESINNVARGPNMMAKKLEPKDIYDFTDTSGGSSLSSDEDIASHSPPSKKEKKTKSSDSPKRSKKDKKKKNKESRSKSPNPYSSPKSQKSGFALRVEDRTPSPILKDDLLSSDGSTPSSSPRSSTFYDHSPTRVSSPPSLSHVPTLPPAPFVPVGSSFSSSPFAPMRNLPCQTNPFPTPPLFTNAKSESGSTFQNVQPLNLAKSGPSSLKSSPEKIEPSSTGKTENSDLIKKAVNFIDKSKAKDHKKEKPKKKGKKETEKAKDAHKKEEVKEKEKPKPKEKAKSEKNVKADKKKSKPEKKKTKDDKAKEDSTVPKMTLKLGSGSGSTKIVVKPNTKTSTSLSSSPENSESEQEPARSPSPPKRVPTPSPPRAPTPPPPPRIPTPPPRSPSPLAKKGDREESPDRVDVPPPISTKGTPSRGRGRGKKAAAQPIVPPARTVITETLGTITDESGNKIWICPACSRADDGSPMIGCDECDDWYHWVCVGIVVPPKEEENWFCVRCIAKRQAPKDKRKRKKHRKEK